MANDSEYISCEACGKLNRIPTTHLGGANCAACGQTLVRNQQNRSTERTVRASGVHRKTLGLRQIATGINILILYFILLAAPHILELARLSTLDYDDISDQSSASNNEEIVNEATCSVDLSNEDFFDCMVGQAIQAEAIAFIFQCIPLAGVTMISVGLHNVRLATEA